MPDNGVYMSIILLINKDEKLRSAKFPPGNN